MAKHNSGMMRYNQDAVLAQEQLRHKINDQFRQNRSTQPSPMTNREIFELSQFQHEDDFESEIQSYGINVATLFHNSPPSVLYEQALANEHGSYISDKGALMVSSGAKTGRSPADKRIVEESTSVDHVWWGKINMKLCEKSYLTNRERALDYLNIQSQLYVVDAYAGWSEKFRVKIRVITTRAYHALFMLNMLVIPKPEDLEDFHPDFVIYNAGCFPANRYTDGVTSQTSVSLHLRAGEMVILGTQYAGEMKKGILTLMMYKMPMAGQLPLHSSCNIGQERKVKNPRRCPTEAQKAEDGSNTSGLEPDEEESILLPGGDVTLFFGLSGTGKTTLSADPRRELLGDDEHVWTDTGVFNIEGGCYAKCKDLTREQEPDIFDAIRYGSVLENVCFDAHNRKPDYADTLVTENTRCAYPLHFIPNARIPATVDTHPSNIILLTCDAFGVLPPMSRLTNQQVMYHFVSGYTSKMTGTEEGVNEPTATFSACYGAPFLVLHPSQYARMLSRKLDDHAARAWLINTGWVGGSANAGGRRCPLKYTRLMVDAINDGTISDDPENFEVFPKFEFRVPKQVPGVPSELLMPTRSWKDQEAYETQLNSLTQLFINNFRQYQDKCGSDISAGGPQGDS